jgi:hypothetical protein
VSKTAPVGETKSTKVRMLEAGAKVLQGHSPVNGFDIYLVGFHPMKDHPEMQLEAHHYCHQMNHNFAQCVLFDGNTSDANMNGVEYIISEKIFESLPEEEKKYWHPLPLIGNRHATGNRISATVPQGSPRRRLNCPA